MYNGNSILGIITARGGSKGIPDKNIKLLAGRPLIEWTIEAGLSSSYLDRLILSSDSPKIIEVAKAAGCDVPFIRPQLLATDHSSSMDVILHALESIKSSYSHFILLQPTSPFRTSKHIDLMIEAFFDQNSDVMVSVKKSKKHPSFMYEIQDGLLHPFIANNGRQLRRQDMQDAYEHNGAIYMATTQKFRHNPTFNSNSVHAFVMGELESIDIDDPIDFEIAELIISKHFEI